MGLGRGGGGEGEGNLQAHVGFHSSGSSTSYWTDGFQSVGVVASTADSGGTYQHSSNDVVKYLKIPLRTDDEGDRPNFESGNYDKAFAVVSGSDFKPQCGMGIQFLAQAGVDESVGVTEIDNLFSDLASNMDSITTAVYSCRKGKLI